MQNSDCNWNLPLLEVPPRNWRELNCYFHVRIRHHFPWVKWLLPESAAWLPDMTKPPLSHRSKPTLRLRTSESWQCFPKRNSSVPWTNWTKQNMWNFLKHFKLVAFTVQSYFIYLHIRSKRSASACNCLHCNMFRTAIAAIFPRLVRLAPATHRWRAAPSWNARSHQSFLIQQNSWVLRAATAGRTSCLACHLLSKYGRNSTKIRNDRRTSIRWAL